MTKPRIHLEPEERGAARTFDTGYLTIARYTGDSDRLLEEYRTYAGVMSGVGRDHGLIVHAGAKAEDGFLIVNLWPAREGSEAAGSDPRRLGVIAQIGIETDRVRREHHDLVRLEVFD